MNHLYLLFLIIPIFGFSQIRNLLNQDDVSRYNLKGQVKELTHKEYEPRYSNDSTYILEPYDFLGPHNYKWNFDESGNLINKTELKLENDSLIAGAPWTTQFDGANRIIKKTRISHQYSKDTTQWKYEYLGDSIINVRQFDNTYKVLYYTYREVDNKEYLNTANSDSSYITKSLFVYDKYDRLIRSENYENSSYIEDIRINTYTDTISNNIFKTLNIWTKFNDNFYNQFEYDEYNNVVKMIIGRFDTDKESINRYEYVYDAKVNWIEKKHFGWRGRVSTVFKRDIEYY